MLYYVTIAINLPQMYWYVYLTAMPVLFSPNPESISQKNLFLSHFWKPTN